MKKFGLVVLQACLAAGLAASFSFTANAAINDQPSANAVTFFDVSELPVRIDEPRLLKNEKKFDLDCAVANRSGEQLLGIRLILMVIDSAGNLRSRITWGERVDLSMYSIKPFVFHPEITVTLRSTDQLFVGIEEVIGHETIWRAAGAEKALRAYSRGQHDVVPTIRTVVNKFDSPRTGTKTIY